MNSKTRHQILVMQLALFLVLATILASIQGAPLKTSQSTPTRGGIMVNTTGKAQAFLTKYGYNPCMGDSSSKQKTPQCIVSYESMIKAFQKRYGLKTTGNLDAPTIREMSLPRCGVKDNVLAASNSKWSKPHLKWSLISYPSQLSQAKAVELVRKAFDAWLVHIPLTVEQVCSTCAADIAIETGRNYHGSCEFPFDGYSGTLAHAYYPQIGQVSIPSISFNIG